MAHGLPSVVSGGLPRVGIPWPWPPGLSRVVREGLRGSIGMARLCVRWRLATLCSRSRDRTCTLRVRSGFRISWSCALFPLSVWVGRLGLGRCPIRPPVVVGSTDSLPYLAGCWAGRGRCYFLRHSGQSTAQHLPRRSGHPSALAGLSCVLWWLDVVPVVGALARSLDVAAFAVAEIL
jgi:hypothetical protein